MRSIINYLYRVYVLCINYAKFVIHEITGDIGRLSSYSRELNNLLTSPPCPYTLATNAPSFRQTCALNDNRSTPTCLTYCLYKIISANL